MKGHLNHEIMNHKIALLAVFLFIMASCKKDENTTPMPSLVEDVAGAVKIWNSSFAGSPEAEWILSSALLPSGGGIGPGNIAYFYSVGYQYHDADEAKSAPVDFGNNFNLGSEIRMTPQAHGVSTDNPKLVIVSGDVPSLNGKKATFLLTMTSYESSGQDVKKTAHLVLNKGLSDEKSYDLTFLD